MYQLVRELVDHEIDVAVACRGVDCVPVRLLREV